MGWFNMIIGISVVIIVLSIISIILTVTGYPQYGIPLFLFLQIIHPIPP